MNCAKGSSVSNVRRFDATTFVVASLLAFGIALAVPHPAQAADAEFIWGNVSYDDNGNTVSDDRIYMQDGQTYAVNLGVSKSAYLTNPTRFFGVTGTLYRLPDSSATGTKTFVDTFSDSMPHQFAWNSPGKYELDFYKAAGPVLGLGPIKFLQGLIIGAPAYAQTDSDFIQSIFFTITDESARPKTSSILFIPGTESSRLYQQKDGSENQVWEPDALSTQHDAEDLFLNPDGTSIKPTYTKANGAIDFYGENIPFVSSQTSVYQSFLQQLAGLKASSTIADYLVFPYDWRMSPEDIVANGTQYDDGVHRLDTAVSSLAATSQTGKVTIVAHSNGGLVAKALMNQLVKEGKANLVDKIILVAVPNYGTPKTLAIMLHGDLTGIPGFVVSQATARSLAENMPDAFDLLPSAAYFSKVATPVIDISSSPTLKASSGITTSMITSASNLAKFLTGAGGRAKPTTYEIEIPDVLSSTLLASSTALHTDLDSWQPPAGVQVIQIAGWGIDTPSEVVYSEVTEANCSTPGSCIFSAQDRHAVNFTEDGDGTVVVPSAVVTSSWPTYYVDLGLYNSDFKTDLSHVNISEAPAFQELFSTLLSSTSINILPKYVTTIEPVASANAKSLRIRVLSPVSLDAYDSFGDHTGLFPNQDPTKEELFVQEQIPNSYYEQFGEGQYIGLPADGSYKVVLHGKSTGTFTFEETPVSGGVAGTPVTFADVPVTASSTATISLSGSSPTSTSLVLDINGDGKADITIASSSQTTDPLTYAKFIKAGIGQMDIGNPVELQLQAKLENVLHLLQKSDQWNDDDDDARDTQKADRVSVRVNRKLDKIEAYIQREIGKPVSKRDKDERITQQQAAAVLGMIEELRTLVETKL